MNTNDTNAGDVHMKVRGVFHSRLRDRKDCCSHFGYARSRPIQLEATLAEIVQFKSEGVTFDAEIDSCSGQTSLSMPSRVREMGMQIPLQHVVFCFWVVRSWSIASTLLAVAVRSALLSGTE